MKRQTVAEIIYLIVMFSIFAVPFICYVDHLTFIKELCVAALSITYGLGLTSCYNICLVAIDSAMFVLYPLRNNNKRYIALIEVSIPWILSVAFMIIYFNFFQYETAPKCLMNETDKNYKITQFITSYIIPSITILICYGYVYHYLATAPKVILPRAANPQSKRTSSQIGKSKTKKLIKVYAFLVLAFFVCYTPYIIF